MSINTGEVSAHEVTRVVSHDGRPTAFGEAIAHYGRIFKTLHILRLADDETCRRAGKRQSNLTEGRPTWLGRCITAARVRCARHTTRAWREDSRAQPSPELRQRNSAARPGIRSGQSAVGADVLASDPAAVRVNEERHEVGDIGGLADATECGHRSGPLHGAWLRAGTHPQPSSAHEVSAASTPMIEYSGPDRPCSPGSTRSPCPIAAPRTAAESAFPRITHYG